MAEVRNKTGLKMASNMFVKSFDDVGPAIKNPAGQPFDVVLIDHLDWGGIANCAALGPVAGSMKWPLSQHSNSHCGVSMGRDDPRRRAHSGIDARERHALPLASGKTPTSSPAKSCRSPTAG
jgi:hypothetical protein